VAQEARALREEQQLERREEQDEDEGVEEDEAGDATEHVTAPAAHITDLLVPFSLPLPLPLPLLLPLPPATLPPAAADEPPPDVLFERVVEG
jgi:hypothetical protein